MGSTHPDWKEILACVEADDARAPDEAVREHVETCQACSRLAGEVRRLVATFADARLPEVPPLLLEKTMAALTRELASESPVCRRAAPTRRGAIETLLRRAGETLTEVWAEMMADSLRPNHALRGATVASPRMLLYETPSHAISLSLAECAAGSALEVTGQVTPKMSAELPTGGVAMLKSGDTVLEAGLSEFGEFVFPNVPQGEIRLEIALGESLIRIAPITGLSES